MKYCQRRPRGFGLKQNTTKVLDWATKICSFPAAALRNFTGKDFSRTPLSASHTRGYVGPLVSDLLDNGSNHRT